MNENEVVVIGAGTMGNGIAHVFAQNGYSVSLVDVEQEFLDQALNRIQKNLDRQIKKELISETDKNAIIKQISTSTHVGDVTGALL